jgi:AraC-like DNA-binding protein
MILSLAAYQSERASRPDRAQRIVDQIRLIYRNNSHYSVTKIADLLKVSPSTLRKTCNDVLNMSAHRYLDHLKQDFAKELLGDTLDKIAYIGSRVGFPDDKYFSTWFKKWEGITPSEWRVRLATKVSS